MRSERLPRRRDEARALFRNAILDAAEATFAQLAGTPRMGTPRRFRSRHLEGLRSWPVQGFAAILVFYLPVDAGVDVLRVLHGARDLSGILDR